MARGDNAVFRQTSFGVGEVSPLLYGRSDFKGFQHAVRKCLNWIVSQQGALVNRPGTVYVAEAKDSSYKARLVPFVFSNTQAIVMEFGEGYIRFFRLGAQLVGPGTCTYNGVPSAIAAGQPIEIASPYLRTELFQLKFAQSGDVVTIAHPNHPPMDLSRLALDGTVWALKATPMRGPADMQRSIPFSVFIVNTPSIATTGVNAVKWSYAVTAVYDDGSESLPGWTDEMVIDRTAAVKPQIAFYVDLPHYKNPEYYNIYVGRGGTWGLLDTVDSIHPGQGLFFDTGLSPDFSQSPPSWPSPFRDAPGLWVRGAFYNVGDRISANGRTYEATVPGVAGNALPPSHTSGTEVDGTLDSYPAGATVAAGDSARFNGSVFFTTNGGTIPAADTAPVLYFWGNSITDTAGLVWQHISAGGFVAWKYVQDGVAPVEYPSVVTYFGQRKVFANTVANPTRFVGTRVGAYSDFNVQSTPLDDDSIDFSLAADRYEEIRSFINLRALLALTSEKDWAISGANGGKPTPSSIIAQPNNVRGASWLDPLVVGVSGLYVQALGNQIWELVFDFYTQSYLGKDVTVLAQHLLLAHTIVDWTYAPVPFSVVWAVRDDGTLLGFTYVREQETEAWHQHTTQGAFESICSIPETYNGQPETGVYVLVSRTRGDGSLHRYIERFSTRTLPRIDADTVDARHGVFLDAAVVSTGTLISGLGHLEGLPVMVLADAQVAGPFTVTGGQIDISSAFDTAPTVVIVGLPYVSDVELLDLAPEDAAIRQKLKNVYRVSLEVADTRGLSTGLTFNELQEPPSRNVSDAFGAPATFSGIENVRIGSTYDRNGRVVVRQQYPLPATLLAIGRECNVGGD